jgi:hypothetical protein
MGCFWESNARLAAASAQGTLRKRRRWQRAHTKLIVVIEAVFQAAMFALNAAAPLNAYKPSHTLSKSPRRRSPEPRWSVQCMVPAVSSAPSVRSEVLALDDRDAGQLRRWGRAQTGKIFRDAAYGVCKEYSRYE